MINPERLAYTGAGEVDLAMFESASHVLNQAATHGNEESQWLRNLQQDLGLTGEGNCDSVDTPLLAPNNIYNNFSPDANLHPSAQDFEIDTLVDSHACPPFEVASKLYQHYLTVHAWLPIVPTAFEDQVHIYYTTPYQVPDRWLATLNLILAIGAQHCSLVDETGQRQKDQGIGREDVIYLSRALKLLRIDQAALLTSTPTPELVQVSYRAAWSAISL